MNGAGFPEDIVKVFLRGFRSGRFEVIDICIFCFPDVVNDFFLEALNREIALGVNINKQNLMTHLR
jgi:hypothetical protein